MNWRKTFGVLAVVLVAGTAVGVLATLATANDLLLGSTQQSAALATAAVVLAGLAAIVLLGRPSRSWLGTPYW